MPQDWQLINSASSTLSSKLPYVCQRPLTSEANLNTLCLDCEPLSFLTDQKTTAETLCCLVDNSGSISECRRARLLELGDRGWRSRQLCSVRWIFMQLITSCIDSKFCSLAICLQLVHIFQSRWFEVLWALYQQYWFSFFLLVLLRKKMLVGGEGI